MPVSAIKRPIWYMVYSVLIGGVSWWCTVSIRIIASSCVFEKLTGDYCRDQIYRTGTERQKAGTCGRSILGYVFKMAPFDVPTNERENNASFKGVVIKKRLTRYGTEGNSSHKRRIILQCGHPPCVPSSDTSTKIQQSGVGCGHHQPRIIIKPTTTATIIKPTTTATIIKL